MPHVLVTTPESLHLMLARKNSADWFKQLRCLVTDEWHELLGSKRGVQVELGLSRLKTLRPGIRIWGISATVGNLDESMDVLLGEATTHRILVRANVMKQIVVESLIPDTIDTLPWAGHLGIRLFDKVEPVLERSGSILLFTNTRSQAEIWYQHILNQHPEWSGLMAMHHGSIGAELRAWVEEALHEGKLKIVVCTSSLDLGVDFRPVETVVQVGSPKGVARFVQRAGRSGHQPGAISRIYFLPTHALELIEAAALKQAVMEQVFETRQPVVRAFDVLVQYLVTLAVGDGFRQEETYEEVRQTFAYRSITREEWNWVLRFITEGGESLNHYEEYAKVDIIDGLYKVTNKTIALRHRLSIGTITGDISVQITFLNGTRIGTIEESFISRLNPGDVFTFAGRQLELVMMQGMRAIVRKSNQRKGLVPSWQGGRMPLSSQVSALMRHKLNEAVKGRSLDPEMQALEPLFRKQRKRSAIPNENQLLIEDYHSDDGYHIFIYPFEGRLVHEGMAMLLAYRIGKMVPISFSAAMNDYGFEILTDSVFDADLLNWDQLFSADNLEQDLVNSTNYSEIARRKFRDIASISGLIFKGYPNKIIKTKHLQASSNLFFEVFRDYEPGNLLLKQAYEEALYDQLEAVRMRQAMERIQRQEIIFRTLEKPSPFCFPILVDSLRERISTENLADYVKRLVKQLEK